MTLSAHVPDLSALEVLLGVAGTGSLNGAARQAGVSQQAVSARIRAMEAQTGVALVHRDPARVHLDRGRGGDRGVGGQAAGRRGRPGRRDRGAAPGSARPAAGQRQLDHRRAAARRGGWRPSARPPRRGGFQAPDIVLTAANTEQVIGHVAAGSADIGFTEGLRRPAGLRSKIIGRDRLVVVVAPGHRWARRRALAPPSWPAPRWSAGKAARAPGTRWPRRWPPPWAPAPRRPPPRCRCLPPRRSARPCWPPPPPRSSASSRSPRTWPRGGCIEIPVPGLDLRRVLRAIWDSTPDPPARARPGT